MFTKEYWHSSAAKLKEIHYIALMAAFIAMYCFWEDEL